MEKINQTNDDRVLLIAEISGENYNRLVTEYGDELTGMIGVSLYIIGIVDQLLQSEEYNKAIEYEKNSGNKYANRWDYFGREHRTPLDWYFLDKANAIIEKDYPKNGTKYARKCTKCNKGMNSGYVLANGDEYYCSDECLHKVYTPQAWELLVDDDDCDEGYNYYTEWECDEDAEYIIENGRLTEIEEGNQPIDISTTIKNEIPKQPQIFNDVDGNELKIGDKVVCLDVDDLESHIISRGLVLEVNRLIDLESCYIEFKSANVLFSFYGHRVLKLKL